MMCSSTKSSAHYFYFPTPSQYGIIPSIRASTANGPANDTTFSFFRVCAFKNPFAAHPYSGFCGSAGSYIPIDQYFVHHHTSGAFLSGSVTKDVQSQRNSSTHWDPWQQCSR